MNIFNYDILTKYSNWNVKLSEFIFLVLYKEILIFLYLKYVQQAMIMLFPGEPLFPTSML